MEWICKICGYVYEDSNFENEGDEYRCPLCDANKSEFEIRDFNKEIKTASKELKK